MMRLARLLCLFAALAFATPAIAQKSHASSGKSRVLVGGTGSSHKGGHYMPAPGASTTPSTAAPRASGSMPRTSTGKIARSEEAKRTFEKQTGFPRGRPGYVIDHKVPLACGGADSPANMEWQTIADGKAKDKVERIGCGRR
jgi:hypothetical protein